MVYILVVIAVAVGDQLTKLLVSHTLSLYESVEVVPGFFNITYITNKGIAFSMLADLEAAWRNSLLITLGSVATVALSIALYTTRRKNPLQGLGLALIVGGACGNLLDRIQFGWVVDFLDLYIKTYHWPAFNVADMAITTGVAVVLFCTVFENEKGEVSEVKK